MILLDTNVVVAHLNGHAAVTAKISSHIEEIAVPALVVAELDYGAKASTRPTENLARLSTFLQCVDQALRLAVEFNLVSLARELTEAAVSRYPRDVKLKRWAKVLVPPVVREYTGPRISPIERDKDIAWLREHADEYRGMWVVLSGGELLAAGRRDIRRALRRIRRRTSAPLFIHSLLLL